MITESQVCRTLSALLPNGRLNECYEADAEVLPEIVGKMLFTTDEFSAEDHFAEDDPYLLGWNIAAGAISDIYACGGTPVYYAHALVVDLRWDQAYLSGFGHGVRDALNASGAAFVGGDCGRSGTWRCAASVIGSCPASPVLRRGAQPGDAIYITGRIGAGNLQAAMRLGSTAGLRSSPSRLKLPLRRTESELVRHFASCCIDTSDGLWSAVTSIADVNSVGYSLSSLPFSEEAGQCFEKIGFPRLLLFLGECGEYELLFTVRPRVEAQFLAALEQSGCTCYRLGQITESKRALEHEGHELNLAVPRIEARDYPGAEAYLEALGRLFPLATNPVLPVEK